MVVMMTKRYAVYWLRASRTFVVRNVEGADVASDIDDITEAWTLAEAFERDHRRRVAARQAAAETAARSRAMRARSAFSLRG
jgi:hypothetical protein